MTQGHVWNFSLFLLRVLEVKGILSVRKKIKVICTLFLNQILVEDNDPRSCMKFQPIFAPGFGSRAKNGWNFTHDLGSLSSTRIRFQNIVQITFIFFCTLKMAVTFKTRSKIRLKFHTWPWVIALCRARRVVWILSFDLNFRLFAKKQSESGLNLLEKSELWQ